MAASNKNTKRAADLKEDEIFQVRENGTEYFVREIYKDNCGHQIKVVSMDGRKQISWIQPDTIIITEGKKCEPTN